MCIRDSLDAAWQILGRYRASLEVLRLALQDSGSPWADTVAAVCATLPALAGDEREAVARLIEQGPPVEDVGTEPYGIDPRLNPIPDYLQPCLLYTSPPSTSGRRASSGRSGPPRPSSTCSPRSTSG